MPETLLAATILAPARQVSEVLRVCRPDDVRLLDAPTATALEVAADLANAGQAPEAVLLNAELLRRGLLAGHKGELVRDRMLDAVTTVAMPELLPEYAAAVLARVFRARLAAAGQGFVDGAENGVESDLWTLLVREGAELRGIWQRLAAVRGEAA